MKSMTIHKLDEILYKRLREMAEEEGLSLNKLVKRILRKSLGLDPTPPKKIDLSFLSDSMSDAEIKAFDRAVKVFDQIDEDEWN